MSVLSKDQLIEAISSLSVIELSELVKALEEKFNVSAAAVLPVSQETNVNKETIVSNQEKTEFSVILTNSGTSKINTIKTIREIMNLGLKEAKDFVDSAPKTVKENITKNEAEEIKSKLLNAGASVEIK
jgi:large subunit ribosomal protein L7/L12